MKNNKVQLAIALATSIAAPMAMAHQSNEHQQNDPGQMFATSSAAINDMQINSHNMVSNTRNTNDSRLNDNAARNASGNISINTAAGDNNFQDNAAALSTHDASFVFGSAVASVNTYQQGTGNSTVNSGNTNTSGLSGSALYNASGNIAVNSAAGASNLQKNNLSISVANTGITKAAVNNTQTSSDNNTSNTGTIAKLTDTTNVTLYGSLYGGYSGVAGGGTWSSQSGNYSGSYQGSNSGSYQGISQQIGAHPYPRTENFSLPFDHDHNKSLILKDRGTYSGSERGTQSGHYSGTSRGGYSGYEMGNVGLSGAFTGQVTTVRYVVTPSMNNASINGSALQNASGNVAVNIASGSGNLQNNSLAMATSTASSNPAP